MTDSERRTLIERLYREALELDLAERPSFLARWCGENADLQREVESMLAAHDSRKSRETTPILQSPAKGPTATPPAVPELVGQTLDGRYYIDEKLISGGIGDFYLARAKPKLMFLPLVIHVLHEKTPQNNEVFT